MQRLAQIVACFPLLRLVRERLQARSFTVLRIVLITITSILFHTGCSDQNSSEVIIDFWAMGREGEIVKKLTADFEQQNPGIRVRVQQIPWSAAHEKLLTAYAGDAMPDLFQLGNTWIPEFVALNALADLDSWMRDTASVDRDDFFTGVLETNLIDDRVYGIPWYVDTRLIFYRKDILARAGYSEPPKNWSEWLTTMARIRKIVGPQGYAVLLPINEWAPLIILALNLDAEFLKNNQTYGNFRDTRFRKAFDFYVDLFRNGFAPPIGDSQTANIYQEFAKGHFSMLITGPWNIGEFNRRLPPALKDQWMTTPIPAPDHATRSTSIAGGASLVMFRKSRHQKAVWRLIEYLVDPARQIEFYQLTGDLPARTAAWQAPALAENVHAQAFWKQLQSVKSMPRIPEWERIADRIMQYTEAVVREEMTADAALTALDSDVDRILEKRRWLLSRSP